MALPDVSRVLDLPEERWRALGARLRELDVAARHAAIGSVGGRLFEPACAPLRRWHLRRADEPVDRAVRMFCLGDPITDAEAASALGDALLGELAAVGLVTREGGRVVSPFVLRAHEGLFFFADHLEHGGQAVMGMGPLTGSLLAAALPARRVGRALDLGCGAGLVALTLAGRADEVVATDINPRAAALARANAALNGITNLEVRTGDLFEPVRGERFDRVLCQPPFFPTPDGVAGASYSHGGTRGDELATRILAELPDHLAPNGRGAVIGEWPVLDEEPLARRLRRAVPPGATSGGRPGANMLVVESEGPDVDAFCIGDTAFSHPDFGAEYERKVLAQREHMERLGIRELRIALVVVEPTPPAAEGWTGTFDVRDLLEGAVNEALVDGLVAAHGLVHGGRGALLAAKLRLREGTMFASGGGDRVRVLFPAWSPLAEIQLDRGAQRIVELVNSSEAAQAAAKRFTREGSGPRSAALEKFADAVEKLLLAGVLEVVPG